MDHTNNKFFLSVTDHTVSREAFNLYHDESLDLVYTYPQPEASHLPNYYQSEDYISHTDGTRTLFEKCYQAVKSIALKNKLNLINKVQPQKGNLLDIGAGTGDFLAVTKKDGWNIIGVEPSEKAKSIAINKGIRFVDDTRLLENQSLDVITMWHVLEHVPDVEAQIKELKRLIKPTGTVFIAVPNFNSYDAIHYGKFWAAYDVPRHLWHFSKTSIKILFEREGLQLTKVLPMPFDAFYVSMLSEKYKNGKINLVNAIVNGFKSNWKGRQNGEFSSHIYVLQASKNEK